MIHKKTQIQLKQNQASDSFAANLAKSSINLQSIWYISEDCDDKMK